MIPEIEQFLAATDLDVAQHVLADVTDISRQDAVHLAEIVVAWAPPQAIANMKRLLREAAAPRADVRALERQLFAETWSGADHAEAVEAYFERRPTRWGDR